jgi:tRNA G10  N-methylase Trm11
MKYLFILGRNPELSEAEINSFLKLRGIKIKKREARSNALFLEIDKEPDKEELDFLGGTIAVGKALSECKKNELDANIKTIYKGKKNNITFALWDFAEDEVYKMITIYLKGRFREEKVKASRKNLTGQLELQDGSTVKIVGNDVDEEYFVFGNYFGKIFFRTDYKSLELRDTEKPYRRESLAISPRLAKIMINLSGTAKGGKIVDAFCGIGVVLSEALIQGFNVVGIDKDSEAINMALKNIEWMSLKEETYSLINEDSTKASIEKVESMVSEPQLGEILREIPSKDAAEKMIKKYENLMINVLRNMAKYVKKRFVFTAPYILTEKGRISCNIKKIAGSCGLKEISSYEEFRKNQVVGREIFVLEH